MASRRGGQVMGTHDRQGRDEVGAPVFARDLQVLKRCGYLASDDPSRVGKDDVEDALWRLLDGLAWRLGVLGAVSEPPTKSNE